MHTRVLATVMVERKEQSCDLSLEIPHFRICDVIQLSVNAIVEENRGKSRQLFNRGMLALMLQDFDHYAIYTCICVCLCVHMRVFVYLVRRSVCYFAPVRASRMERRERNETTARQRSPLSANDFYIAVISRLISIAYNSISRIGHGYRR